MRSDKIGLSCYVTLKIQEKDELKASKSANEEEEESEKVCYTSTFVCCLCCVCSEAFVTHLYDAVFLFASSFVHSSSKMASSSSSSAVATGRVNGE